MKNIIVGALAIAFASGVLWKQAFADDGDGPRNWAQWGQNSRHQGFVTSEGQDATSILADIVYDPFTAAEEADQGGTLLVHYQVPLIEANNVWMEFKTGTFTDSLHWDTQIWNEKRLHWEDGNLVEQWTFQSDWKPVSIFLAQWEPVFHAVLAGDFIYVPGKGGSVYKLDKEDGTNLRQISPFGAIDANTYVAGPLSADSSGNIYYNAIKLVPPPVPVGQPYQDLVDSWLVKIASNGTVSKVSYGTLMAPAHPPAATDTTCERSFAVGTLPWPPSPSTPPRTGLCGAQRPGLNIAPAIGPDGTIYTASRGHQPAGDRQSYVVAVHPNLTLKWATSLVHTLTDGCGNGPGFRVPIAAVDMPTTGPWDLATFKGKCRHGANVGVDPSTNRPSDGRILDAGTSSPTVLPDGNILFGAYTRYNIARGHTYKLRGLNGAILATYDFGWDDTIAVVPHRGDDDNGFSVVMKDNHYDEEAGFYCNTDEVDDNGNPKPVSVGGDPLHLPNIVCDFTSFPAGPFYITQLNSNLVPEWKFQGIEHNVCHRNPDGSVSCVDDGSHPHGFEWCINAPAVDGNSNVYVASEDGNIYVLDQGHSGVFTTPKFKLFTNLAVGAAYTPFSIDTRGRLYAQNNGHLFVIGEGGDDVHQNDESSGRERRPADRDSD